MKISVLRGLVAAVVIPVLSAFGASDYLLVIEGIPGESKDAARKGAIEIDSFSWGVSQTAIASGGGGGTGKAVFNDIQFSKQLDKSSPLLFLNCANGTHIKTATLFLRKSSGDRQQEYYVIKLSDVLVTSIQTSGGSPEIPRDSFSLNFAKIEVDYSEQKLDGTMEKTARFGWDVKANVPQ